MCLYQPLSYSHDRCLCLPVFLNPDELEPPRQTKCPQYLGQPHDEVVELGLLGGGDDVVHADLPQVVPVLDVLRDAAVEQDGLLGHNANLGAQVGHVDTSRVMAINQLQESN